MGLAEEIPYLIMKERRDKMKFTVLHRPDGVWHQEEISRIVGLSGEVYTLGKYPEHAIIFGHHTKEKVLEAIWGGAAFTVRQVTGLDNPDLPFKPSF